MIITRSSKKLSLEDAIANLQSDLSEKITNLTTEVRSTKDEVINLKDVIIKRLQDENELLRKKSNKLENKVVSLESSINQVKQYGRRNNIVISGIPDGISDNDLGSTVFDIMKDVDVDINSCDIKACHRIGKSDQSTESKKTIVCFINRKYCKKALLKKKIFATINTVTKYNFSRNNQIFVNESLTKTNESLAFYSRKLKRSGLIHCPYLRKVSMQKQVHHIDSFYKQFPEFVFLMMMTLIFS